MQTDLCTSTGSVNCYRSNLPYDISSVNRLQHATPLLLFWRTSFSNHHHYSAISTNFFADFSSIHAQLKTVWRRDAAAIVNVISWPNITAKSILREKGMVNFEVNHRIKKMSFLQSRSCMEQRKHDLNHSSSRGFYCMVVASLVRAFAVLVWRAFAVLS